MRYTAVLFLIFACSSPPAPTPPIGPRVCFQVCNSSIECSSIQNSCRFCNFGECRATRPESKTDILHCQEACAPGVLARPRWCDEGGCALVLRGDQRSTSAHRE